MDSYNPFSQASGFMDLLHSQQESHNNETNQYEVGSSEIPVFGTQRCQESHEERSASRVAIARKKWAAKEDIVLISAWLNTSKDPVVGNEQKAPAFWKRIASYVAASPDLDGVPKRASAQCKQRWAKMNELAMKFVGCYATATNQKASGQTENDVMLFANELFKNDMKKKKGIAKRRKVRVGTQAASSQPIDLEDDDVMRRPPGVKAAKVKAKKTPTVKGEEVNSVEHLTSLWDLKEKDWDRKDKQSKNQMLESLLSRTEPLSECDLVLKKKLIEELFS
ncbi:hypothetical protein AXX17_AT2G18280 [Arabidopsis thaliana]|nr:hypothetical protein AXX17_AT2G18280 [Arabidopsis thaliana]